MNSNLLIVKNICNLLNVVLTTLIQIILLKLFFSKPTCTQHIIYYLIIILLLEQEFHTHKAIDKVDTSDDTNQVLGEYFPYVMKVKSLG